MAGTTVQDDRQNTGAAAPASVAGLTSMLGGALNNVTAQVQRVATVAADTAATIADPVTAFRNSPDPAQKLFGMLKTDAAFKSDKDQAKIKAITDDKAFMSAINLAIKNDPSVMQGLLGEMSSGNASNVKRELVDSFQDGINRRTMGKVFNAVAQKPDDALNYQYIKDVQAAAKAAQGKDAKAADREKLREELLRSGTRDIRLEFATNPMALLKEIFANPQEFFKNLPQMLGFQGVQADRMGEFLGKYVGGSVDFMAGNKQDREIAGRLFKEGANAIQYYTGVDIMPVDKSFSDYEKKVLQDRSNENTRETNRASGWKSSAAASSTMRADNTNDASDGLVGGGRIQAASACTTFNPCATGANLSGYTPPAAPVADNSDFRMQPARFGLSGPSAIPA